MLSDEVTFRDLRHFYASLLNRHGASVKTVQARLGHKSATETLDTCGHSWPRSNEQTRNILNEALIGRKKADSKLRVLDEASRAAYSGAPGFPVRALFVFKSGLVGRGRTVSRVLYPLRDGDHLSGAPVARRL